MLDFFFVPSKSIITAHLHPQQLDMTDFYDEDYDLDTDDDDDDQESNASEYADGDDSGNGET